MPQFTKNHVFILPHAEKYRQRYEVSIDDVLLILNDPEEREGLAEGHYTTKRTFATNLVFLDYFVTLSLQGDNEIYAIIDYVGCEPLESLPNW
jgi:hypothetical protein